MNNGRNFTRDTQCFVLLSIKVKVNECVFDQDSVEYLGHVIDKRGLHTS